MHSRAIFLAENRPALSQFHHLILINMGKEESIIIFIMIWNMFKNRVCDMSEEKEDSMYTLRSLGGNHKRSKS